MEIKKLTGLLDLERELQQLGTAEPGKSESKTLGARQYNDKIKNAEGILGFFNFYKAKETNSVLMEIKPEQLGQMFLCSVTRIAGNAPGGINENDSEASLENYPLIIKKIGNRLQFIKKNLEYRADPASPINKALQRGISDSLFKSVRIEAVNPENGNMLIDPSSIFITDIGSAGYVNITDSYFDNIKSYPKNTEVEVILNLSEKGGLFGGGSKENFFHKYNYSLTPIPEQNYMPRLADPTVGYFKTTYNDLTDPANHSTKVNYIERWALEKQDPNSKLSPPKEPIVFWIENTISPEYKDAVRKGVEVWNKTFEKIGFKDALVVKEQPRDADWDPADIRFNTICFIVNPGTAYAVGPSFANPLNGQIYAANIRIAESNLRHDSFKFDKNIEPLLNNPERNLSAQRCSFAANFSKDVNQKLAYLESNGAIKNKKEKEQFLKDSLTAMISHEVGHALGLRHNFKGSNEPAPDGKCNSIMDYLPIAIQKGPDGIKYYIQTEPGPYDEWAIEYGYKPIPEAKTPEEEKEKLKEITLRGYPYGPDEDKFIDPGCNVLDRGDPIKFYKDEIALSKKLLKDAENNLNKKDNASYSELRKLFEELLAIYIKAIKTATKYFGGTHYNRGSVEQLKGRLPIEPVSREEQLRALEFLKEEILSPDSFKFSPELLNKLAPDENEQDEGTETALPVYEIISKIQKALLEKIYSPDILNRIVNNEMKYKKDPFEMSELFSGLREAIWKELNDGENISSLRSSLQQEHITKLITLYKDEKSQEKGGLLGAMVSELKPSTPAEARALARADIVEINKKINTVLDNKNIKLNAKTQAHLRGQLLFIK